MKLLHRHRADVSASAERCWVCDPTSHGATHRRQVRDNATAQAQLGYGSPREGAR